MRSGRPGSGCEHAGKVLVQVKNAKTGSRVKDVPFNKACTPRSLAVVPDVDANPGWELALLGLNESTGKVMVDVKDALTGTLVKSVPFTGCGAPQAVAVVPDTNANGASELAVLGVKQGRGYDGSGDAGCAHREMAEKYCTEYSTRVRPYAEFKYRVVSVPQGGL